MFSSIKCKEIKENKNKKEMEIETKKLFRAYFFGKADLRNLQPYLLILLNY